MKLQQIGVPLAALIVGLVIGFGPGWLGAEEKIEEKNDGIVTMDRRSIEAIIHDYLMANPEIIIHAVDKLREDQEEAREAQLISLIRDQKSDIFYSDTDHVAGNPNGDLVVVEFFDYRCGYCKRFHPVRDQLLEEDDNIRFVLKEFPVLGADSLFAAKAAIASAKQGKYLEFHDAMMEVRGSLDKETVLMVAEEVGMDIDRLTSDINSREISNVLRKNAQIAQQLGIDGTPGFVIGDRIVTGAISLDQLEGVVADARKSCKQNDVC